MMANQGGAIRNIMVRGGADFSALDKAMGRTAKNARSMQSSFSNATRGMQSSVTKLTGVLHKAMAVAGVASFAALSKKSMELASDLEEVQNVVDVSFGKMSEAAERFAKNAGRFNLSELQAKDTSSMYMSMAKSLGVAEEQASRMSIAAAALTGDLGSFRNISQDVAATAIASIFTEETASLKKYGVNMTQAALKAYALEKGIEKSYDAMTDAEKVTLRYAFVMERLSFVQGDAERTADSWANKLKRVTENAKAAMSDFGAGLINILDGPLSVLDQLLYKIQYAAKLFKEVTGKLFSKQEDGSEDARKTEEGYSDAADSVADLTDNITDAGEAAKKALLPMDQLHKLGNSAGGSSDNSPAVDLSSLMDVGSFYDDATEGDGGPFSDEVMAEIEERAEKIVGVINKVKDKFSELRKTFLTKIGVDIETATAMDVVNGLLQFIADRVEELLGLFGIDVDFGDMSFDGIKKKVGDLTHWLDEHKDEILDIMAKVGIALAAGGIAVKVGKLVKTISLLGGPLKVVATLASGLIKTIGGFSPAALAVAACVAVVVAALTELYQTNENVRAVMDMAWSGLKDTWQDVCIMFQTLYETVLQPVFDALGLEVENLWDDVILPVVANLSAMLPGVVALIKVAIQTITDIIGTVGPAIGQILVGIAELFQGMVDLVQAIVTGDWAKVWEGFKNLAKGAIDIVVGLIEGVINSFKAAIDFINPANWAGKVYEAVGSITGDSVASNIGKSIRNGGVEGRGVGTSFSLKDWWKNLTGLASGGVVYGESVVRVGEYAGASTNPEIVAPQGIIRETLEDANKGVIDALYAMSSRVCKAIEDNRAVVNVGGKQLEQDITRQQNDRSKMTGKPILTV